MQFEADDISNCFSAFSQLHLGDSQHTSSSKQNKKQSTFQLEPWLEEESVCQTILRQKLCQQNGNINSHSEKYGLETGKQQRIQKKASRHYKEEKEHHVQLHHKTSNNKNNLHEFITDSQLNLDLMVHHRFHPRLASAHQQEARPKLLQNSNYYYSLTPQPQMRESNQILLKEQSQHHQRKSKMQFVKPIRKLQQSVSKNKLPVLSMHIAEPQLNKNPSGPTTQNDPPPAATIHESRYKNTSGSLENARHQYQSLPSIRCSQIGESATEKRVFNPHQDIRQQRILQIQNNINKYRAQKGRFDQFKQKLLNL